MVSVIIPNYNHANYLKRRIDSVLNQTYSDFEIILLDDCSSDNSKEFHPKVSHVIINKNNTGSPFIQWKKGFELAKGEFIWIAESDDWCESSLLETLVNPLIEDNSLSLSFCQSLLVDESSNIIYKTENKLLEEKLAGRDFVVSQMFGDTVLVNAGMAVFRKSVLQKIDEKYKEMRGAGDWMFWVQIALQGNVFISGKYLNYFMRHVGTVSSKTVISGQDIDEGNEIFLYVLKNTNPTFLEIKYSIVQRLNIYFQQKGHYVNKQIEKDSLNKIFLLHPISKSLYKKMKLKRKLKKFIRFFINI